MFLLSERKKKKELSPVEKLFLCLVLVLRAYVVQRPHFSFWFSTVRIDGTWLFYSSYNSILELMLRYLISRICFGSLDYNAPHYSNPHVCWPRRNKQAAPRLKLPARPASRTMRYKNQTEEDVKFSNKTDHTKKKSLWKSLFLKLCRGKDLTH